jgi:hypothetical protein
LFLHFTFLARAQEGYFGPSIDFNSGFGTRAVYGLGIDAEVRITGAENLYLNWHFGIGGNEQSDLYGRVGVPLLLYRQQEWWNLSYVNTTEELMAVLFGPLICPHGVTYYLPVTRKDGIRYGFYGNPLGLELWKVNGDRMMSWTFDAGSKVLFPLGNDRCLMVSTGLSLTNPIKRSPAITTELGRAVMINVRLGIVSKAVL